MALLLQQNLDLCRLLTVLLFSGGLAEGEVGGWGGPGSFLGGFVRACGSQSVVYSKVSPSAVAHHFSLSLLYHLLLLTPTPPQRGTLCPHVTMALLESQGWFKSEVRASAHISLEKAA